jgi:hypothetical protein
MSLCISSFNLRRFGDNAERDFPLIAKIIKSSGSDLVAIQEASGESAVVRLCQELGTDTWQFSHAPDKGFGFAFLWKQSLLTPAGKTPVSVWSNTTVALTHPPLVGFFRVNNSVVALINIQIIGSRPPYHPDKKREFRCLCDEVFPGVEYAARDLTIASYVLMLGDYNLRFTDIVSKANPELNISLKTVQDQPTTIKNQPPYAYSVESLDHFSYRETWTQSLVTSVGRFDAPQLCNGDFGYYRKQVSDHVPILLSLAL